MTNTEKKFFIKSFADSYFKYLEKHNASYLARIYGIYTVKMAGHSEVHLMMMSHTLKIKNNDMIEQIYDLKGSTVNREVEHNKNTSRTKTL